MPHENELSTPPDFEVRRYTERRRIVRRKSQLARTEPALTKRWRQGSWLAAGAVIQLLAGWILLINRCDRLPHSCPRCRTRSRPRVCCAASRRPSLDRPFSGAPDSWNRCKSA